MTEVIDLDGRHVCPGLVDPHMHIESSNLTLGELARAIVPRGVLVLVADPHEIANVLGMAGIEFLLGQSAGLPLDVLLRVPGRVPALPAHLETS
ncbi:MAG: amidohydrolase family protein, partial [Actinomycetota bacterium]|nr:amidohydrolase family protein [Actinomycetota bacterium]